MTTHACWKDSLIQEGKLVLIFLFAAFLWVVFLSGVIPYLYENLSRVCYNDHSYLWNGYRERMQGVATVGGMAIVLMMPVWVLARLAKRAYRSLPASIRILSGTHLTSRHSFQGKKPGGVSLDHFWRDAFIAVALLSMAAIIFYASNHAYVNIKSRYFDELIQTEPRYKILSEIEKAQARVQYEAVHTNDMLPSMIKAYGVRAWAPFYLSFAAFWAMIWGIPSYIGIRFLIWTLKALDPDFV